ncbi:MAG: energy-coupling factor ABC transporter ATP-binding protein [Alphaproteobacteria bacterium]
MSIIELKSVTCKADEQVIIDDISLKIDNRQMAIIGANGSGKSTLIRLLNGLILPDTGNVRVDERSTEGKTGNAIRKDIGFMFQNPEHQIIWPMVKEDLIFSLKNHGYDKAEYEARVDDILAKLKISYLKEAMSHELSGGERQLVALAGLLIIEPKWLIFDEPTAMLDLTNELNIKNIIRNLKQQVIVVTHDLEWVKDFERIIWIDKGRIMADGSGEIVNQYHQYITAKQAGDYAL